MKMWPHTLILNSPIAYIFFFNIELQELIGFYIKNIHNLKIGIININIIRFKFQPLAEALNNNTLDVFMIRENKLDESFPAAQFALKGFNLY